jgi:hypothetical protein
LPDEIGFLFDPRYSAIVGGWGVILTTLGFAVTIWQLVRTTNAVKAANSATAGLRARLAAQTAAISAANALARLKAAQRELRAQQWAAAAEAMDELRDLLLLLHTRADNVPANLRDQLPEFLKDLIEFVTHIERRGANGVTSTRRSDMGRRLRELSSVLMGVAHELSENVR